MANMKDVNKALSKEFPTLDVVAVRGTGYIYFTGKDGWEMVKSVWVNPTTTSTPDTVRLCIEAVDESMVGQLK